MCEWLYCEGSLIACGIPGSLKRGRLKKAMSTVES